MNPSDKAWSTTTPTYSTNVGRTSALSASRLVELSYGLSPITSSSHVLGVGARTGAVTFAVAGRSPSTSILATDISPSMLENISEQQLPNVSTRVVDGRNLVSKLEKASFTHVFNTFMLQTITAPLETLRGMHATLTPGGVLGVSLWAQRNGPFGISEQAAQTIHPNYKNPAPFDDPNAWRTQAELEEALSQVDFHDVMSEMPFEFANAKAFVEFWFRAKNPASVHAMSNFTGNMKMAEEAVEKIVKDEYADGKEIYTWAVLGIGRK